MYANLRWRTRVALRIVIGAILMCTSSGSSVWAQTDEPAQRGLDLLLLVDSSDSMQSSDRTEVRSDIARLFVDYLSVAALAGSPHRAGVINFGAVVGTVNTPLRQLTDDIVRDGIWSEALGHTDFKLALDSAYQELRAAGSTGSSHRSAIVLVTDGTPCTPRIAPVGDPECSTLSVSATKGYFDTQIEPLIRQIAQSGIALHVITLGQTGTPESTLWRDFAEETGGTCHALNSETDLGYVLHTVIGEMQGREVAAFPHAIEQGATTVQLENPYLNSVTFLFVQEDAMESVHAGRLLTLTQPDALDATGDHEVTHRGDISSGLYELWTIEEPIPGPYTFEFSGPTTLKLWIDESLPQIRLQSIHSPRAVDEPLSVTASLERNGLVVTDPLQLGVTLRAGNTATVDFDLADPTGTGAYVGSVNSLPDKGDYSIRIVVRAHDRQVAAITRALAFSAVEVPTIERMSVVPPIPEILQSFDVEISISNWEELSRQQLDLQILDEAGDAALPER